MAITWRKLWRFACDKSWRACLRVVYIFSPAQYWNLRGREIHATWFDDHADYRIMKSTIEHVGARSCLEIGCNGGRFSRFLIRDLDHLECQDISQRALKLCAANLPPEFTARATLRRGGLIELYGRQTHPQYDLVISNRVLSAIPPKAIAANLAALANVSRALLINEILPGEPGATYYWFAHDYDALLAPLNFRMTDEIVSNSAPFIQRFRLYERFGKSL